MTSKLEKRAFFEWQKSSDEYLFSVTLLIALFAIRNEFVGNYKIGIYIAIGVLVAIIGYGLIRTKLLEFEYLQFLKDNRYHKSKWDQMKEWIIFFIYILMAFALVYLGMEVWKEFFEATFS